MQECHLAAVLVMYLMEEKMWEEAGWTRHLKKPKVVPGELSWTNPSPDSRQRPAPEVRSLLGRISS